jgi:hypothetical protein
MDTTTWVMFAIGLGTPLITGLFLILSRQLRQPATIIEELQILRERIATCEKSNADLVVKLSTAREENITLMRRLTRLENGT